MAATPTQIVLGRHNSELRFDLVKIAFAEALRNPEAGAASVVGLGVVKYADAVLAAMEKTPDTGLSAAEIARRARGLAGDVLSEVEKPNLAIVRELRAEIRESLAKEESHYAEYPTTDQRTLGFREGFASSGRADLRLIDAATEKASEAEDGMSPYERDCHKHNLNLCTGEPNAK